MVSLFAGAFNYRRKVEGLMFSYLWILGWVASCSVRDIRRYFCTIVFFSEPEHTKKKKRKAIYGARTIAASVLHFGIDIESTLVLLQNLSVLSRAPPLVNVKI